MLNGRWLIGDYSLTVQLDTEYVQNKYTECHSAEQLRGVSCLIYTTKYLHIKYNYYFY